MSHPSLPPLEDCTVEFSKAPPDTVLEQLQKAILAIWMLPRRIYNTYLLIRHRELKKPASKNVCPMRYLNPFLYLNLSAQIAAKPAIIKAILKHPRKDPEQGIFDDTDNSLVFMSLLSDLYPDETITADDYIFTCNREHLRKYRQPILRFIGPQNIEKHSKELQGIIENTMQFYCAQNGGNINATEFSLVLTIAVVSRLLLGHPGPFDTYREIAYAVDSVNKFIMKKTLKQPLSKEEKEGYFKSLQILRSAIDVSLHSEEKPAYGSFVETLREEKSLTPLQIQLSLYAVYSASSDTTSALLNYLLWQLGQHPDLQEEIFQEINRSQADFFTYATESLAIDRILSESMRLFTPAYVIGRKPAGPLLCTIKDRSGNIVFQQKIGKNEKLLSMITLAARDPHSFENPDQFHPQRFSALLKSYSWSPFGDGAHSCPGQWLAKAEVALLIALLTQKYQIFSSPEKEFEQLGYLSLKPSAQVTLRLLPRM